MSLNQSTESTEVLQMRNTPDMSNLGSCEIEVKQEVKQHLEIKESRHGKTEVEEFCNKCY